MVFRRNLKRLKVVTFICENSNSCPNLHGLCSVGLNDLSHYSIVLSFNIHGSFVRLNLKDDISG